MEMGPSFWLEECLNVQALVTLPPEHWLTLRALRSLWQEGAHVVRTQAVVRVLFGKYSDPGGAVVCLGLI